MFIGYHSLVFLANFDAKFKTITAYEYLFSY